MSIRLETVQTVGRNLKQWCRRTLPLICLARYLSDRPIDWFFFWIGCKFICRSESFWFRDNDGREEMTDSQYTNSNEEICSKKPTIAAKLSRSKSHTTATSMTTLPCEVLSNMGSFLHPRDVLALDTVLRCYERNDNDVLCQYHDVVLHEIWKRLWYRDYGEALLQWKVARQAFRRSLIRLSLQSTDSRAQENGGDDEWVEENLSNCLDEMPTARTPTTTKDFYFIFGECYVDYLLARKNKVNECYIGLHGHIFDFTDFAEYHPGLIEPILKECGGDATYFFEDLPHSSGARNIAKRLCVIVNHSAINQGDGGTTGSEHNYCGLELVLEEDDSSELKRILRTSNTRPPSAEDSRKNKSKVVPGKDRNRWMQHIVPRRRQLRRHPTLEKIRTCFQRDLLQHEYQLGISRNKDLKPQSNSTLAALTSEALLPYLRFWVQKETRIYFDPLLQEWIRWNPEGHEQV